ncbi:MAG: SDR family NAD(P)-dependent oxidoreductase [Prosthecobacter sp.]
MKALVTGGAGFIGSHIAQTLCAQGAEVIALDNLCLGNPVNLDWKTPGDRLEFVQGDVNDEELVKKLVAGCDWVFHQGALPSVPRSVQDPWGSHVPNIDGTLKMLLAARDAGVKRFLFASSSSIYGDVDAPVKHESLPPNPLSPYALQKYAGEKYGLLFHQLYGFPFVALRYFNIFGPRQAFDSPYSGVIAKFCTHLLNGERPLIHGDGLQSRDFTYVGNAVAANLAAASAPAEKVAGRTFNVACGESITLLQLIADLNELLGTSIKPEFGPGRAGDVRSSLADISAAVEAFGYAPAVDWKVGLAKTLDFYRSEAGK